MCHFLSELLDGRVVTMIGMTGIGDGGNGGHGHFHHLVGHVGEFVEIHRVVGRGENHSGVSG